MVFTIPGHSLILQARVSFPNPVQLFPPKAAAFSQGLCEAAAAKARADEASHRKNNQFSAGGSFSETNLHTEESCQQ